MKTNLTLFFLASVVGVVAPVSGAVAAEAVVAGRGILEFGPKINN